MGDLKEEFLKAGLIDERAVERVERKRRAARRRMPTNARNQRRRERCLGKNLSCDPKSAAADGSPSDRPATGPENATKLLRSDRVKSVFGSRRFYFVDRNGRIPFLELNESAVEGLTNGTLAIVEADDGEGVNYVVVEAETARRLETVNNEVVRFWNRHE
jgi:hypothetical protein